MAKVRTRCLLLLLAFTLALFLGKSLAYGKLCQQFRKCAKFEIATEWNGAPIDHDPVKITLSKAAGSQDMLMRVEGPFFDDPPNPGGKPGDPFPKLWDYEVAEAFFLGDKDRYLEVEISPHGQHLILVLSGVHNMIKQLLPMKYSSQISSDNKTWSGEAIIPHKYFPPGVKLFNAYAIHGSDKERTYESLYPTPKDKYKNPDFHRLQYFKAFDFRDLISVSDNPSPFWKDIIAQAESPK